jgi:nucleoside-diphosphate-sugar epimerase
MTKTLFIGGTGTISEAVTELAVLKGIDLYHLNRGQRLANPPAGVTTIHADIRDINSVKNAIKGMKFDCVVDWISFVPEHIETDLELFAGNTDQFIFISSASAYQKPPVHYRVTESTPLHNPFWEYSRNKIKCENMLMDAYRAGRIPVTIVRPSYTYNNMHIPFCVGSGYTIVDRMRKGKPVIVHGDGQSLWVMTHNTDFAKGFIGLIGNQQAIGESFHITSDEVLTWDQIAEAVGKAAGAEPKIIHIASDFLSQQEPHRLGDGLLGDKACTSVFDNSKIKRAVPEYCAAMSFQQGVSRAVAWHDADPQRQKIDEGLNDMIDRLITAYGHGIE